MTTSIKNMRKRKILYPRVLCYTILLMCCNSLAHSDAIVDGNKGIEEFRKGNLIEAMQLLRSSAKQGYAPAQNTLAYILDQSEVNEDAFYWFQQAALQGHAAGQLGLGNMYAKGEGIKKDPIKAGEWIEKSARQMHVPAMRAYAYALEFGQLGFTQDKKSSGQWYLKAANAGDEVAMRRLSKAYRIGELGFKQDSTQAIFWESKINNRRSKP